MFRSLPSTGHPIEIKTVLNAFFKEHNQEKFFLEDLIPDVPFFLVNSGSAALTLGLQTFKAFSLKKEVILPAYTCPSILAAVIKAGLTPVLCDIMENFQMNLEDLSGKIGSDTLAVIPVHLFGLPENLAGIRAAIKGHDIFLLEDAAQAFGNSTSVTMSANTEEYSFPRMTGHLGLFGDLSIFSFGRGKPLSLLTGGVVVVNNPDLYESTKTVYDSLPVQKNSGIIFYAANLLLYSIFYHPRMYWLPKSMPWLKLGETYFSLKYTMEKQNPRLFSVLGDLVFKRFDTIRNIRYELKCNYLEKLLPHRDQFIFLPQDDKNVSLIRFPVVLKDPKRRDRILSRLKQKGLGASEAYPVPLHQQPGVTSYVETQEDYPGASFVSERIMTLPLHSNVTVRDIIQITFEFNK